MDAGALSGVSALVGSVVGLSASVATSWVAQRTQARRLSIDAEIKKREALYAEFITECSKLAIDALDHSLDRPDKILTIYALANRIRLCASENVIAAADQAIQWIGNQYMKENLAPGELRQLVLTAFHDPEKRDDPLQPFSKTCRRELASLNRAL
jgi:alkylation response protein AidB-like acyl-CoA dehydrogenase